MASPALGVPIILNFQSGCLIESFDIDSTNKWHPLEGTNLPTN